MKSRKNSARAEASDMRLHEGAELDVTVERILPGGVGLAHAAGRTIFIALAAPGDHVRVRVETVRARLAFASIQQVITPSPVRVEPPCAHFGRCGGCDFQQLEYDAQLVAKVEIISDSLRRVARIEPPAEIPIAPSPDVWRYRARARWQYDPLRKHLGYFERGSHRIRDVADCPVAAPPVQDRLTKLRAAMSEERLPDDALEFEAIAGDEGVALAPAIEPDDARAQSRVIGGERYHFDANCFFQINHGLLEPLVREGVREAGGESALDLYSGVGLFTLPLARSFKRVIAVEGNAAANEYARRNLEEASLSNARVETAAVGVWLAVNAASLGHVEFVLLDPPRAGAEADAVRGILALKPRHISYVSCDPATLGRDLRLLTEGGYHVATVRAFDMFPQTHHVETVVHLFLGS